MSEECKEQGEAETMVRLLRQLRDLLSTEQPTPEDAVYALMSIAGTVSGTIDYSATAQIAEARAKEDCIPAGTNIRVQIVHKMPSVAVAVFRQSYIDFFVDHAGANAHEIEESVPALKQIMLDAKTRAGEMEECGCPKCTTDKFEEDNSVVKKWN